MRPECRVARQPYRLLYNFPPEIATKNNCRVERRWGTPRDWRIAVKILVVDDEKLLVKGMKFNLENEGYTVDACYDGGGSGGDRAQWRL